MINWIFGHFGRMALVAALVTSFATPNQAQPAQEETQKRQQIREIVRMTGATNIGAQMIEMMVQQIAPAFERLNPDEGALVASILRNEFLEVTAEHMDDFEEMIVLIYYERFSAEDVEALLVFYQSPAGQRMIEALPAIVDQSMRAGQALGERIGAEAVRRAIAAMQEEGLETPI